MRSFMTMYRLDVGHRHVAPADDADSSCRRGSITTPQTRLDFMRRMEERLNAIGAIAGASTTSNRPLGGGNGLQLAIDGKPAISGD